MNFIGAMVGKVRYHWGIIFVWDPNNLNPFKIYPLEMLPEVSKTWINGPLPNSFRNKKLDLGVMGCSGSFFAKIEYGMRYLFNYF